MGLVLSSVVVITMAAVIFYRYILKTLRDTKLKELLEGKLDDTAMLSGIFIFVSH